MFIYVSGIITIVCAIITFISFLCLIFTDSIVRSYQETPKAEVALKWSIRFSWIKSWSWQWTIYMFAFTSLCAGLLSIM